MGLLDGGMAAVFGAAFGGVYLDGVLERIEIVTQPNGDVTEQKVSYPIKGHIDRTTEQMRQAAGYVDTDVALIVLRSGLPIVPDTDSEVTLNGQKWAVASVEADPANTHWIMRGQKA